MNLYEVAVAAPITQPLTYSQPDDYRKLVEPGRRVLVPLGNRLVTGYVLGPADTSVLSSKKINIKPIADILDPEPIFPASLIPFYRWISSYYHYPIGEVVKTALPGGLATSSGRHVRLTGLGKDRLPVIDMQTARLPAWRDKLLEKDELSPSTVRAIWRKPKWQRLLKKWEKEQLIEIDPVLVKQKIRPKTEITVCLTADITEKLREKGFNKSTDCVQFIEEQCSRKLKKTEQRTLELYCDLFLEDNQRPIYRPQLSRLYRGSIKALQSLAEKEIVTLGEQRVFRDPFGSPPPYFAPPEQLTDEQQQVLEQFLPSVDRQGFQPFLLFGVTGCGKTEVYLQATGVALDKGKTVLVLVPEIALATQLEAHFYSRFGNRLAVLHSGLSTGERFDQWQRILQSEARVVIGARSAVFAPLPDLGLVLVDEEHEPAYKQDDGLRYNGRDLAVLRAQFADCPVMLGSATPSVTSFHHAGTGKYKLFTMSKRILDRKLPEVRIVDLGKAEKSRPDLFFSDSLITALHENMEKRQQSLLFVNRRGYASFMLCRDCGHIIQCRHCQVSLTMHRGRNKLICHYCGYSLAPNIICPACGSGKVTGLGLGSERIEDEVRQLIPHARVARLDSDTTANRKNYLAILKDVRDLNIDILVGTQMIAKGLHFPNMTLVGVIWADSGLGMPDFKASERTFELLSQVAGRAGRGEHSGRVIIQTNQPNHYAVRFARFHDYNKLYKQEIALRRDLGYPPFARMVNIRISAKDDTRAERCGTAVAAFLRARVDSRGVEILGPAPAPLARLKGRFRWQLLLKGHNTKKLHELCDLLLGGKSKLCPAGVRLAIDVDPENMM